MYSDKATSAVVANPAYSLYRPFAQENIREGTPTGKGTVLTLSNGRYDEFLTTKKIETIGSVRFNTEKNKIVGFGENKRQVEVVSRFLSVDPIAKQYPELTPYQFASNTPLQAIDLDGLERLDVVKQYDVTRPNTVDITITSQRGSIPNAAVAGINNQPPLNTITAVTVNLQLGNYRIRFGLVGPAIQNLGGDVTAQTVYTNFFRYDNMYRPNGQNAALVTSKTTRGGVDMSTFQTQDANGRNFFGGDTYGRRQNEPNTAPQASTINFQGGSSNFTDRDAAYNSLMPQMVYDFRNPATSTVTINVYGNTNNLNTSFYSPSLGTFTTMQEILTNRAKQIEQVFNDVRKANNMPAANVNINILQANNQNPNNTATVTTQ